MQVCTPYPINEIYIIVLYSLPGLAQYSGDPRIEWHLNAFTTKDAVLDAVKNLPYKGGNTLTGTIHQQLPLTSSLVTAKERSQ